MGFEKVKGGYKGLKGLQIVIKDYRGLQGGTRDYRKLQGVTGVTIGGNRL